MMKWVTLGVTDKGKILAFPGRRVEPKQLLRLDNFEDDGWFYPFWHFYADLDDSEKIRKYIEEMIEIFKKTLENAGYEVKKREVKK